MLELPRAVCCDEEGDEDIVAMMKIRIKMTLNSFNQGN
jgi:hypothetical protein